MLIFHECQTDIKIARVIRKSKRTRETVALKSLLNKGWHELLMSDQTFLKPKIRHDYLCRLQMLLSGKCRFWQCAYYRLNNRPLSKECSIKVLSSKQAMIKINNALVRTAGRNLRIAVALKSTQLSSCQRWTVRVASSRGNCCLATAPVYTCRLDARF